MPSPTLISPVSSLSQLSLSLSSTVSTTVAAARSLLTIPILLLPCSTSRVQNPNRRSNFPIILVTGGAGYIGSHPVLQLLLGGFSTFVVDNLKYSSDLTINRLREFVGDSGKNLVFHKLGMGARGVISDKWSMRALWACAIGSAISLYFVAAERQAQNRERMLAESLKAMEEESHNVDDA